MSNPLILAAKIQHKRSEVRSLEEDIQEINEKSKEFEEAIADAKNDEELAVVEKSIEEYEKELNAKKELKDKVDAELADLETELEESNKKQPKQEKEGAKRMENTIQEQRNGIEAYVRNRGKNVDQRDKFTTVEGGALIPQNILRPKLEEPYEEIDLAKYINTVQVNRPTGTYPIIKRAEGTMISVKELEENPELKAPTFKDTDFKVETYRGEIPISQEMIDDAEYDVVGLIADSIRIQELNTKNAQIAKAIQGMEAKTVKGADGLKKLKNVDIKQVYNGGGRWIVSASLFNALDTLKDKEGRYLLQQDIKAESGKSLFGKPVEILDDEVIGKKDGDLVGFYGNLKAAVTLFDRKQATARWIEHHIYGQILAGFSRFQVKVTDPDAGFYFTYTPDAGETVAGA